MESRPWVGVFRFDNVGGAGVVGIQRSGVGVSVGVGTQHSDGIGPQRSGVRFGRNLRVGRRFGFRPGAKLLSRTGYDRGARPHFVRERSGIDTDTSLDTDNGDGDGDDIRNDISLDTEIGDDISLGTGLGTSLDANTGTGLDTSLSADVAIDADIGVSTGIHTRTRIGDDIAISARTSHDVTVSARIGIGIGIGIGRMATACVGIIDLHTRLTRVAGGRGYTCAPTFVRLDPPDPPRFRHRPG